MERQESPVAPLERHRLASQIREFTGQFGKWLAGDGEFHHLATGFLTSAQDFPASFGNEAGHRPFQEAEVRRFG